MTQPTNSTTHLGDFLSLLKSAPETVQFEHTLAVIDANYNYRPTSFTNGVGADMVENPAGTNHGSSKILAFAKLNNLDSRETLYCFGRYYREEVLRMPDADNHQNIRTFIRHGIDAVEFEKYPLSPKGSS